MAKYSVGQRVRVVNPTGRFSNPPQGWVGETGVVGPVIQMVTMGSLGLKTGELPYTIRFDSSDEVHTLLEAQLEPE